MARARQVSISIWELGKGALMIGGFLAVLVQIGRYWGVVDQQLQGISSIQKRLDDIIVPAVLDHAHRLETLKVEVGGLHDDITKLRGRIDELAKKGQP